MPDNIDIDDRTATALELTGRDRTAIASRLAEIGGLRVPSREGTADFLVDVLQNALSNIPESAAAWSWGEFYNGGIQPLYDIDREQDWQRLAAVAVDLDLDSQAARARPGELLTPRQALSRNLGDAIDRVLREVRERLEAAGVSP